MLSPAQYESEIAFLTGVTSSNTVAAVSYYTYDNNVPPAYTTVAQAIKWGDPIPGTAGGTVKYWFDPAAGWNNTEKDVWAGAFSQWAGLANISFSLADDAASANVTLQRLPNKQAYASFNSSETVPVGSDKIVKAPDSGAIVTIDTTYNGYGPLNDNSNAAGGYPYSTVIHELGHIIGLGHAGPYNGNVNTQQQQFSAYDTTLWSIMSYINPGTTGTTYYGQYPVHTSWGTPSDAAEYQPLTPQMLDILAIQRLYGVSTNDTFGGNQTFGFNSSFTGYLKSIYDFGTGNNPSAIVTLWSHGTNNALDVSGFSQNATIDLTPGTFSSAGGKVNNIGVAFNTVIETAKGGQGNDTIKASNVASTLDGGDGNDTLIGGAGNDTLYGGTGNDLLQGGAGNDQLYGGAGNDTLQGGDGNDILIGGDGDDVLVGGAGLDILTGGSGADIFQFTAGQANGDIVTDFSGRGGDGDLFQFFGYGTAAEGATFTKVDDTHWKVTSADGAISETITIANGAEIAPADVSFHPAYSQLANSSFMDLTSWRSNSPDGPSGGTAAAGVKMNVALILDRANDPTDLLNKSWAERQKELKTLNDNGTLWSTYGADQTKYDSTIEALGKLGINVVEAGSGYVSSAASRTIWVEVTAENFSTLFGPQAQWMTKGTASSESWYWTGNLSLPQSLAANGVSSLWFDTDKLHPVLANPGTPSQSPTLDQGWQSEGNSSTAVAKPFPNQIADSYYKFPLPAGVATGAIGLVEPGVGTAMLDDPTGSGFQAAIDAYRAAAGITTSANVTLVAPGGQAYPNVTPPAFNPAGERSLDVGVVTAINPQSPLIIYAGAGPQTNAYTAYQASFWDTANNPAVITSSFGYTPQTAPGSPFYSASRELFVDAALRNISVFNDNGDGGSGNQTGNGVTNVSTSRASPYAVMVGGTSLSTGNAAQNDASLETLVKNAQNGDLATIWSLIAGGLTTSPVGVSGSSAGLVETVWNRYYVDDKTIANPAGTGYIHNNTGSGGVDPSQPPPWYQTAYGLVPTTSDPSHLVGRGTPDVSANAGGNMLWHVPGADMTTIGNDDGTSAATPMWAAFASQVNTIFADQNLPQLGYMNDLLYIAAAIAPASFNDITLGNNTSSFVLGGSYTSDKQPITPTGYGYSAGAGYDLATGLGTPNGTLLARALTEIAHHQTSYGDLPGLIVANGSGGWTSGSADQSFLVQATTGANTAVHVTLGTLNFDFTNESSGQFAWTARMAQQSLQSDFDPDLVRMFDKYHQGGLYQGDVAANAAVSAIIGAGQGKATQADLTSDYGFADFSTQPFVVSEVQVTGGTVHLARAVAVAETVNAASDQNAVVRIRQNGEDNLSVSFYKVDDYSGKIGTLKPGDVGYAEAAAARSYSTLQGGTAVDGPGYGLYTQTQLTHVNSGDLIAMQLTNKSSGDVFWAFSQANEKVDGVSVGHLWNYGANTWGWEDTHNGGDRDYNDLIVQLDFTSASGHGWLV